MTNDLNGYLGGVDTSQVQYNPISGMGHKGEKMQYEADVQMAMYNNQVHEAELLKQRQWALEDAQYNSPAELRKRLEEAGYNPALMSGAIQTANAPVRSATSNTPSGSISNMSGYASARQAAFSNIIQAGQNLSTSYLQSQQAKQVDANINLLNSQSVNTLAAAAKTSQDKQQASDLFSTQKQALEADLVGKVQENSIRKQYYEEVVPQELQKLAQDVNLSNAQIQKIAVDVGNQTALTNAQIKDIKQGVKESAQRILQSSATIDQLSSQASLNRIDAAIRTIQQNVQDATSTANKVNPYIDIISKIIQMGTKMSPY